MNNRELGITIIILIVALLVGMQIGTKTVIIQNTTNITEIKTPLQWSCPMPTTQPEIRPTVETAPTRKLTMIENSTCDTADITTPSQASPPKPTIRPSPAPTTTPIPACEFPWACSS